MTAIRDILVAVAGLTPQVITETLYYLTQVRNPPATLAAVHVLTTQPGKARLLASLLAPGTGHFYAFCAEYGLDPASLIFDAECVHVLHDAAGRPLDDIRTAADSLAVADQIITFIRRLTEDPMTRLHCSLAGGRKTQSVLLGFALQLYGRPQDTLLHVLVSEDVQDHPEFFYPPKAPRSIRGRDGRLIEMHTARVDVAEIPYVRLRDIVLLAGCDSTIGFAPAIAQAQHNLDMLPNLPPLVITCATRCIRIGAVEVQPGTAAGRPVCPACAPQGAAAPAPAGRWLCDPARFGHHAGNLVAALRAVVRAALRTCCCPAPPVAARYCP